MKRIGYSLGLMTVLMLSVSFLSCDESQIVDLSSHQSQGLPAQKSGLALPKLSLVKLQGKLNHFGMDISQSPPQYIDYHATVPDAKVWIAEFPFTRHLNIRSDETGWWTMYIIKRKGVDLAFSLVYEKEGWITTKSNKIRVTDEDNLDLAIQFIDPAYYTYAVKPTVEGMLGTTLANALVVTVGKSWASMHDDRLPHGDAGALAVMAPLSSAIGPIYFNEAVFPDPTYTATSIDGGVAWINVPAGEYHITAQKTGVAYETVTFDIRESDADKGIVLYIASPPDSIQGDNDSPPGE
ncbi:MAG: hypothetical protein ACOZF0_06760 [Thermodesulfobacteriota bacterium]